MNNAYTSEAYIVGVQAMADSQFSGRVLEAAQTMIEARKIGQIALYEGGQKLLLSSLSDLQAAGADLLKGLDARDASFLSKGNATMQAELMTTSGDEHAWRFMAMARVVSNYRSWFKKCTITETKPAPIPSVHVASLPERISQQLIERDGEGQILATTTLQRDAQPNTERERG